jgi:hypothetical protein
MSRSRPKWYTDAAKFDAVYNKCAATCIICYDEMNVTLEDLKSRDDKNVRVFATRDFACLNSSEIIEDDDQPVSMKTRFFVRFFCNHGKTGSTINPRTEMVVAYNPPTAGSDAAAIQTWKNQGFPAADASKGMPISERVYKSLTQTPSLNPRTKAARMQLVEYGIPFDSIGTSSLHHLDDTITIAGADKTTIVTTKKNLVLEADLAAIQGGSLTVAQRRFSAYRNSRPGPLPWNAASLIKVDLRRVGMVDVYH